MCRWHNHCSQKGSRARGPAACSARSLEHTMPTPPRTHVCTSLIPHRHAHNLQQAWPLSPAAAPPALARPPRSPLQSTMRPGHFAQQGPCCWASALGHPWKELPSCLQTRSPLLSLGLPCPSSPPPCHSLGGGLCCPAAPTLPTICQSPIRYLSALTAALVTFQQTSGARQNAHHSTDQ